MAEHAIELVEIALVLHQRGARQIVEILDSARGEVGLHRLHQREVLAQRHRHAGRFEVVKESDEHGVTFRPSLVAVKPLKRPQEHEETHALGGFIVLRRDRALWAFAVILSIALLIAPALWNGFALLQWDSGGYLARWYEGYLVPSRAVVYGLMLNASAPLAFWPVLLLQSALTIWIFALMLRAHGLGARPLLLLGIVAALSVFTTLPWLTSILLTDIFCGLSVMALYLLLLRDETLKRYERASLIALIAVSAATHNATLAVLLGLLAAATLSRFVRGGSIPLARLGHGALALALGCVLVFAADFAVAKRLAWTPGGFALSF